MRNWQGGSVYSATVNTYNARDQITQVRQYAGAEGSGTYQDTTLTYDGYGRVKTKHVPEQNAGTATTWDYNSDDTIQKITDARGASQTFSYNNRHLMTGITYAAPAGITIPAAVGFAYDAAGNRTSMTDGHGSKTYAYDQLSRLNSETRTISGVGTLSISYGYNLAGLLTSVTDPFGAQVAYVRDSKGRVTSVNGSGFAGLSTYASGATYRAWGAIKHLNYSNGISLDMGHGPRLQSNTFDVHSTSASLLKSSYQYYADGTLRTVDDQVNNLWDRAYAYDASARMTSATAGPGTGGMPSYETFGHDAFNNLTNRMTELWSNGGESSNVLYLNNRRQNDGGATWQYDAAGNVLSITHPGSTEYQQYSTDAAGRTTQNMEHSRHTFGPQTSVITRDITIDQNYDGAGARLKRVETKTTQLNGGTPTTSQKITYELHSSVLGGVVITELNALGQKQRSNVFAGGELLAVQQKDYQGNDQVLWSHSDPLTGTTLQTKATGQIDSAVESQRLDLDPLGGAIPPTNPALDETSSIDGVMGGRGWYMAAADPFNPESGCAWDGMSTPCRNLDMIMRYLGINPKTTLPNFDLEGGRDVPFGFKVTIGTRITNQKVKSRVVYPDDKSEGPWSPGVVTQIFVNEIMISQQIQEKGNQVYLPQKDKRGGSYLTPCVAKVLRDLGFGKFVNIDDIRVHMGFSGLAGKLVNNYPFLDVGAITIGNDIYFKDADLYQPTTVDGIAFIGHEVTHSAQQAAYGALQDAFFVDYALEFAANLKVIKDPRLAYEMISYERWANKVQTNMEVRVKQQYGNEPCKKLGLR